MLNKELGHRMEYRRKQLGLTLDDVGATVGVTKSTIQRYEKGRIRSVKLPVVYAIARALDVDPNWLCGIAPTTLTPRTDQTEFPPLPDARDWEVVGSTNSTVSAPDFVQADAVFRCVGDSLINTRIYDGDTVFLRFQPSVTNGQLAVIRIEGNYFIRRVYQWDRDCVELHAENPIYPPVILRGEELNSFEVIGLVVAFLSAVR